jgi:hypothetical protein
MRFIVAVLLVVALGAGGSLAFAQQPRTAPQKAMLATATAAKATGCSRNIASHVYNPDRLTVYSRCLQVTGTIVDATHGTRHDGVRREKDGDTHGWLRLDPEFKALLNSGNRTHEGGNLVFEIVCYWKPTQADAISSCPASYRNRVVLPPVGSRVQMTGAYVQDENHAHWMEIHPATSIRVIQ